MRRECLASRHRLSRPSAKGSRHASVPASHTPIAVGTSASQRGSSVVGFSEAAGEFAPAGVAATVAMGDGAAGNLPGWPATGGGAFDIGDDLLDEFRVAALIYDLWCTVQKSL